MAEDTDAIMELDLAPEVEKLAEDKGKEKEMEVMEEAEKLYPPADKPTGLAEHLIDYLGTNFASWFTSGAEASVSTKDDKALTGIQMMGDAASKETEVPDWKPTFIGDYVKTKDGSALVLIERTGLEGHPGLEIHHMPIAEAQLFGQLIKGGGSPTDQAKLLSYIEERRSIDRSIAKHSMSLKMHQASTRTGSKEAATKVQRHIDNLKARRATVGAKVMKQAAKHIPGAKDRLAHMAIANIKKALGVTIPMSTAKKIAKAGSLAKATDLVVKGLGTGTEEKEKEGEGKLLHQQLARVLRKGGEKGDVTTYYANTNVENLQKAVRARKYLATTATRNLTPQKMKEINSAMHFLIRRVSGTLTQRGPTLVAILDSPSGSKVKLSTSRDKLPASLDKQARAWSKNNGQMVFDLTIDGDIEANPGPSFTVGNVDTPYIFGVIPLYSSEVTCSADVVRYVEYPNRERWVHLHLTVTNEDGSKTHHDYEVYVGFGACELNWADYIDDIAEDTTLPATSNVNKRVDTDILKRGHRSGWVRDLTSEGIEPNPGPVEISSEMYSTEESTCYDFDELDKLESSTVLPSATYHTEKAVVKGFNDKTTTSSQALSGSNIIRSTANGTQFSVQNSAPEQFFVPYKVQAFLVNGNPNNDTDLSANYLSDNLQFTVGTQMITPLFGQAIDYALDASLIETETLTEVLSKDPRLSQIQFKSRTFYDGNMPNGMGFAAVQFIESLPKIYGKGSNLEIDVRTMFLKWALIGLENQHHSNNLWASHAATDHHTAFLKWESDVQTPKYQKGPYDRTYFRERTEPQVVFNRKVDDALPALDNQLDWVVVVCPPFMQKVYLYLLLGLGPYPLLPVEITAKYKNEKANTGNDKFTFLSYTATKFSIAGAVNVCFIVGNADNIVNGIGEDVTLGDAIPMADYVWSFFAGDEDTGLSLLPNLLLEMAQFATQILGLGKQWSQALLTAQSMQAGYLSKHMVAVNGWKVGTNHNTLDLQYAAGGKPNQWNKLHPSSRLQYYTSWFQGVVPDNTLAYLAGSLQKRPILRALDGQCRLPAVTIPALSYMLCGLATATSGSVSLENMPNTENYYGVCTLVCRRVAKAADVQMMGMGDSRQDYRLFQTAISMPNAILDDYGSSLWVSSMRNILSKLYKGVNYDLLTLYGVIDQTRGIRVHATFRNAIDDYRPNANDDVAFVPTLLDPELRLSVGGVHTGGCIPAAYLSKKFPMDYVPKEKNVGGNGWTLGFPRDKIQPFLALFNGRNRTLAMSFSHSTEYIHNILCYYKLSNNDGNMLVDAMLDDTTGLVSTVSTDHVVVSSYAMSATTNDSMHVRTDTIPAGTSGGSIVSFSLASVTSAADFATPGLWRTYWDTFPSRVVIPVSQLIQPVSQVMDAFLRKTGMKRKDTHATTLTLPGITKKGESSDNNNAPVEKKQMLAKASEPGELPLRGVDLV